MKPTGYVGMVDKWDELIVGTTLEVAIAFSKVDVDFYGMLNCWHGFHCKKKIQFGIDSTADVRPRPRPLIVQQKPS